MNPCYLPLAAALLSLALPASPPANAQEVSRGPWAADGNGDGRITREEMTAWMTQRFAMMDPDGDGFVPVEAMQRMLGHDRPSGEGAGMAGGGSRRPGRSGEGERHGPGGREGLHHGAGGGPGGRPPRDRLASAAESDGPPPPPGRLMPRPEDSNEDGMIDRDEFLAPALAMFADRDLNGDGVLTADELPPPLSPAEDEPPQS